MSYFDGFVLAVPTANKDKFVEHAKEGDAVFKDQGAVRIVEAWGDDVPKGKVTDFQGAVQATDEETVVFSWIEWPDKASRDGVMARSEEWMKDPRMDPEKNPMPFDGKRMIYGGFDAIVDEGEGGGAYADGYLVPVPEGKKKDYRALAIKMAPVFRELGATRVVEAWGDDLPDGKHTDYRRAVKAEKDENVVFSFVEWPDKATRDAGWAKMMEDNKDNSADDMPFDGKRMFWGGFRPIVEL
ncbi:DUF1428 domain-containing protein [Qipengyuania sp. 6D47A]|uniref:DUF1428 domain-containing protein n=1 Tax=Qipengyuania qiaonensis TaxID=2867240 RepID=A0ABS7J763_9SPHN|nr:DUF1428 domain-containing protein [Qipengyuania qiaonensis]